LGKKIATAGDKPAQAADAAIGAPLGRHVPAMTLVQVSGLIDPSAKVGIEGEAMLP
jgi:hypothetical protein